MDKRNNKFMLRLIERMKSAFNLRFSNRINKADAQKAGPQNKLKGE
jgi:hypothetical protein